MDETLFMADGRAGQPAEAASRPNAISFGSQMLAVGAGFCVFIMLLALFAAIQHRKRRRSSLGPHRHDSFRSPLIHKHSYGGGSQAIPPPPAPQYLRCSNQSLRKCSSPGGSDYSLSSSYSSSSAHSLSPMSPYAVAAVGAGSYQHNPFAGLNFIPYGGAAPVNNNMDQQHLNNNNNKRRASNAATETALLGVAGTPELVFDADGGRGCVSLQLAYDQANLALQITVLACNGLPKFAGNSTPLNPYIKLRLLPEGQHRVKTRILRDTRDPVFDEAFTMYGLSGDTIRNGKLHLSALAFDRYNGDTVLGETVYSLADFHADGLEPKYVSLKWQARNPFDGQKRGKALVGIQFNANTRTVKFSLLRMDELPADATLGLLDPYAKVYALLNGQRRIAKQKTRVLRRTLAPVFGPEDWLEFTLPDTVCFDPISGIPTQLSFHVVLFNHDGVKRNEPIGQFTVDAESDLFTEVFQQQNNNSNDGRRRSHQQQQPVEWHTILPL